MKNPSPLDESWWAEFRRHFWKSKFVIFMQPSYVNFLKYYKKCFTTGSIMRSRIQSTFQNIEFYYFYSRHILIFYILWQILNRSKRLDEQNADHFSECRSLLFLCNRHMFIFKNIMKNLLPFAAQWWAEFTTFLRMSMYIIFM